jgi:hypothetical protein
MKLLAFALFLISSTGIGQTVSTTIPKEISKSERFLFYLHGAVVTRFGNNAINQSMPEWGPYEYLNILDSLRRRRFNVISENRKEGIDDSIYVNRILQQVDTLIRAGVNPQNILVVGASAGWDIGLRVSSKLKRSEIKYVILGGCWPDTYKDYVNIDLYGHFLSIIETTDPHGTCYRIFEARNFLKSYQEIKLNMGLSHGFIYKGYKEWIDPIVVWFEKVK